MNTNLARGIQANGAQYQRQGIVSLNCAFKPDAYATRQIRARDVEQRQQGYRVTGGSDAQGDHDINTGEALLTWKNEKPSMGDQQPFVFNVIPNLVVSNAQMSAESGATRDECAINFLHKQICCVGVAKTNLVFETTQHGQTVNPPVAAIAGLHHFTHTGPHTLNIGDQVVACIVPDSGGAGSGSQLQGIPRTKLLPQWMPIAADILFPTKESMMKHWDVHPIHALNRNVDESAFDATRRVHANDFEKALKAYTQTVAMHAIDLYRAQLAANVHVADVSTAVLVGLEAPKADDNVKITLSQLTARTTMKQSRWSEGVIFSKALLRLSLGYAYDDCRTTKPQLKTLEMSAYERVLSALVDAFKSIHQRYVGTVMVRVEKGHGSAIHIKQ